jgi:hypothetical protein
METDWAIRQESRFFSSFRTKVKGNDKARLADALVLKESTTRKLKKLPIAQMSLWKSSSRSKFGSTLACFGLGCIVGVISTIISPMIYDKKTNKKVEEQKEMDNVVSRTVQFEQDIELFTRMMLVMKSELQKFHSTGQSSDQITKPKTPYEHARFMIFRLWECFCDAMVAKLGHSLSEFAFEILYQEFSKMLKANI